MLKRCFLLLSLISFLFRAEAKEGMWIPLLIDKNISEMQKMGFNLSSEDIYSANNHSMKDAIVLFGSGCTGEIISPDGLLVTNYHCGYGQIQSHSSVANDYLDEGFWAMNKQEELPNANLKVTFLVRMEDVTDSVFKGLDSLLAEDERSLKMRQNIAEITKKATVGTHYTASVKPFFLGNQYFLFVNEVFADVRLVGAPPSSIGKFGGDTDNWMWPRHTGDFSLFRIYADKDNNPADYSPENVPYKPKKYFSISLKEPQKGDFTMVFGYPGSTRRYIPSMAVAQIAQQSNPDRISIRDVRLNILQREMLADHEIRIKYAAKYATISNSWKKWQGESLGINRRNVVAQKIEEEKDFLKWVNSSREREIAYGAILPRFDSLYREKQIFQKGYDYFNEIIWNGIEAFSLATAFNYLYDETVEPRTYALSRFFQNYVPSVDEKVFVALLQKYHADLPLNLQPVEMTDIFKKKDVEDGLVKLYRSSLLTDSSFILKLNATPTDKALQKRLKKDNLFQLLCALEATYEVTVSENYYRLEREIASLQQLYMKAILEKESDKNLYPDANLTLRITYGQIEGFEPADAVEYGYYTTLDGVMEKGDQDIPDYRVPEKLRELYEKGDYGQYARSDGKMPICFVASNHTSGGNSGSPVINADGNLMGINFDRCWEGTMSDIMFDPDRCRNISLDMHYMLFIIDKYAGAGYLLDEMDLVR